ncbi:PREDICTED: uncharacterized protein LOC105457375 [Wasmannia auropunctata]|uniref:uncharacterized protein LOC105457375 n=1 Tax=Wasmannia auropunctata TaxID=64793 RepID=UPI0005ED663A|nr:PREDICTED: uncharacterized protein LOC105457375 [Wasmannia auropunctata]
MYKIGLLIDRVRECIFFELFPVPRRRGSPGDEPIRDTSVMRLIAVRSEEKRITSGDELIRETSVMRLIAVREPLPGDAFGPFAERDLAESSPWYICRCIDVRILR